MKVQKLTEDATIAYLATNKLVATAAKACEEAAADSIIANNNYVAQYNKAWSTNADLDVTHVNFSNAAAEAFTAFANASSKAAIAADASHIAYEAAIQADSAYSAYLRAKPLPPQIDSITKQ